MSFSSDSVLEGNSECNPIPSSSASTWELSSFNFIPVLCLYVDRQVRVVYGLERNLRLLDMREALS